MDPHLQRPGFNKAVSAQVRKTITCGIDQNRDSVDVACIAVNTNATEVKELFVGHMFEEVLGTQLFNDMDDPIIMITWTQRTFFTNNALIVYIKYRLPPIQQLRGKGMKRERRLMRRRRKWVVAIVATKLLRTLRILHNKYGYHAAISIEDLEGLATKRKISFMYYRLLFNAIAKNKELITNGAKVFRGWGNNYLVIQVNPRKTSTSCGLCHLEGKWVDDVVVQLRDRKVKCKIHGTMDRDFNASLNIAILGLITLMRLLLPPGRGRTLGHYSEAGMPRR